MPDIRKGCFYLLNALAFAASLIWSNLVSAQAEFYKGKTITVIAGTTAGALYDQWSRLLAQHMGKHIPGNPSTWCA